MHFFEGVEKRVIVNFSVDAARPEGLRALSTDAWKAWCRHARCSILSRTSNEHFDAFVLSESSLFVYPTHIIAKTCGSTTLLHAVEPLIELAATVGCQPEGVCFTRMNYNFPEGQVYPHTSFEEEVEYLDETFVGRPYILGPLDAERYHLYLADSDHDGSDKKIIEVQMFELDPERMRNFFRGPDGLDGETQTRLSGIDTILPGSTIDSFAFDPCGYSMNGLLGEAYWTIHITPEDHCSYVSFETNLDLPDYGALLERVTNVFRPKRVCVSLLARKDALKAGKGSNDSVSIAGFKKTHGSTSQAADAHELAYAAFSIADAAPAPAPAAAVVPMLQRQGSQSVLRKLSPSMPPAKNRVSGRQPSQQQLLSSSGSLMHLSTHLLSAAAPGKNGGSSGAGSSDGRQSPRSETSGDYSIATIPFSPSLVKPASAFGVASAPEAVLAEIREHLSGNADSFFVTDLGKVTAQYQRWMAELPSVVPHYAVKCNPDPVVVRHLKNLGASFDCASESEISLVLSLGVSPAKIVYANPTRPVTHLRFAKSRNVDLLTADSIDELVKIGAEYPTSRVLIRIAPVDADAICPLGAKFGATERGVKAMLELAKELRIDIAGVAFHVGSGARSLACYTSTLRRAKAVFDEAIEAGFRARILDIGGGMPGKDGVDSPLCFADIAAVVRPLLSELFPTTRIIAEPGRYFVADALTLATRIVARRDNRVELQHELGAACLAGPMSDSEASERSAHSSVLSSATLQPRILYYIGDGIYGSFNCLLFDHATVKALPMRKTGEVLSLEGVSENDERICTIFGGTCDALDCIAERTYLPTMEVGDWLYWECMGAYTSSASTEFNGFAKPLSHYIDSRA